NTGQALATTVSYDVSTRNGSIPPDPFTRTFEEILGGDARVDTFVVTAANTASRDTTDMVITGAFDGNSGQPVTLIDPQRFDSVPFEIQDPATLVVDSVVASQKIVTQLQTEVWYDTVYVQNTGQAELQLDPPKGTDLTFLLGGVVQQTDYEVTPPTKFESGDKNWVIPGDTSEVLVYRVDATGRGLGPVTVRADLGATDINDDENDLTGSNSTSVTVIEPSGLFISTTISQAINKSGEFSYVNTGDTFFVEVEVENTHEAVRDVALSLKSSYTMDTLVVWADSDSIQNIGTDTTSTFRFAIQTQSTPVSFQTLTAHIESAYSAVTGLPVDPSPAFDDDEFLVVQTPADLAIESFAITSPPTATDGTLSTGQPFYITARVANLGQAELTGNGQLTVSLQAGFSFDAGPADSITTFDLGTKRDTSIVWKLRAPNAPDTNIVACNITMLPTDKNANVPATASVDSASFTAYVQQAGDFRFELVEISTPYGARDGEISTDQEFTVHLEAFAEATVTGIEATISVPSGFVTIGNATKS
ncbi:MAG: hypothetical protein KAT30_09810, partial [Candidatus Krumholzibacteria bacterium]|nr:hypothetical protein [Candidatus Krumholzibacteria bacterium]